MKPIRDLCINGRRYPVVEENIMLRLNGAGTGFITINAADNTPPLRGKPVELSIGYNDQPVKWFSGYVESDSCTGRGLHKLMVREAAAILQYPLNISMQHPTLKQVAGHIEGNTGLRIQLPKAGYTTTPVPHLTHNGNGYQLMAMLGRIFSIPDYVWYPSVDGIIYAGSFADCRFAKRPARLPVDITRGDHGANGWTIQTIPMMRPGVVMNDHRINQVQLQGDSMIISWSDGRQSPVQRQIETLYPEIGNKTHLPRMGRVISPTENTTQGDLHDEFRPRYAVNVQLLDENGTPDKNTPVYNAVPVPVPMAGNESGIFQYPPPGTIVTLAHVDGRPDKPIITGTHASGQSLPGIKPGEQLQQQRAEVFQRVHTDGTWQRETDQVIREKSTDRIIQNTTETRTSTTRNITVKANNTITVLGTHKLMSGHIQHIADGDYAVAATKKLIQHADSAELDVTHQWQTSTESTTHNVAKTLEEKIGRIKKSVAGQMQQIIAPQVWFGSNTINTLNLMLDLCDTVQQLAQLTAQHTHTNNGSSQPTNSGSIDTVASMAGNLKAKYSTVIKQ
ncbi:hypothetical protein ACYRA0_004369 [Escherichia coli]|uniref:Uncharacterized protein conserved in bacteria n=3 Tax=Enterobacteriaceae TaxID=543 RepID=A0A0M1U5M8_ECOLX|nr:MULTISPECIES: hypothetical protein [Enterobacteriaceae]AKH22544.1 hypothetical protein AA102_00760 [Escherichia coli]MDA6870491.1 hypothetical protein [Escherichia coli]MDO2775412.1 hypothetical protein [Escherichia coli]MDS1455968.1 hypothetical protein [Escherichia coli]MDS1459468.1 hypothetical protein [Escherichia coli]